MEQSFKSSNKTFYLVVHKKEDTYYTLDYIFCVVCEVCL
jgi:formate hydrogenlyase subunit 6/NADH:ubiquinone oxidoreductase subunit I